jgi:hypothetical protein
MHRAPRTRRCRPARVSLAGLCAAATIAAASCGGSETHGSGETTRSGSGSVTYADRQHDFKVTYPSSWHRARRPLTPTLVDPVEILSIGTTSLTPGGRKCAQFPENAVASLGPGEALIWVSERAGHPRVHLPPRPARFRLVRPERTELHTCVAGRTRFSEWPIGFREAGRQFNVFVAIGKPIPRTPRVQAERVLDSLELTGPGRSGERGGAG